MSAIYAIIDAANRDMLNQVFAAMGHGPTAFLFALTDDPSPTAMSPATHYHIYDANAHPSVFSVYAAAKAGTALPLDNGGNPIAWGIDAPSEEDAYAAFSALQLWANESDRLPHVFAAEQRAGLGLSEIP